MPEECLYGGSDTTAVLGSTDDGGWFARCHCGETVYTGPSYDDAIAALDAHRAEAE